MRSFAAVEEEEVDELVEIVVVDAERAGILYVDRREERDGSRAWKREMRSMIAGMGSEMDLGGRAERRARVAFVDAGMFFKVIVDDEHEDEEEGWFSSWLSSLGKIIPGASKILSLLSILTSRMWVVMPASAPVGHAEPFLLLCAPFLDRRFARPLMTLLLPTLG